VVSAYYGSQADRTNQRYELMEDPGHVIITTYNLVATKEDRLFLKRVDFKSMVLDEGRKLII
jgi:SNF2 family DNA or RNA helicase